MRVNCEGCAGCCLDWRPVDAARTAEERTSPRPPLDDAYNLAPLLRDEVRAFLDAGYGDALVPRLFEAGPDDDSVVVDGHEVAAIGDRPVFYLGLRKLPKPVAPFGLDPVWLDTCAFLDPETLQCRIHDSELYPRTCGVYPGHNLLLDQETECERVEAAHGGDRLLDDEPADGPDPLFGPQALGAELFVFPDLDRLDGAVDRLVAGEASPADRAMFVGVAAASAPGSTTVDGERAAAFEEEARAADSWVGEAAESWVRRADSRGSAAPAPSVASEVDGERMAPDTPGW